MHFPAVKRPAQDVHITVHPLAFAMRGMPLCLKEIGRQHRRNHTRDRQAHQHRDHDSEAKVLEELARHTGHQANWQEDCNNTKTGRDNRQSDLVRRVDRCLIGRFAHPHMPHDILDLHNRIVDEHPGHKAERKQRQEVEVEPDQIHEPEGRDGRQRNGNSGNHRCTPVTQEEEDHDHSQDRAFDHSRDRALILAFGIFDGVEQRNEPNIGIFRLDFLNDFLGLFKDSDVGCALGARHIEIDHFLAAHLADRRAFGIAVPHPRYVRQLDRTAVGQPDLAL